MRGARRAREEQASGRQRRTLLALGYANAFVCIANIRCLLLLGEAETQAATASDGAVAGLGPMPGAASARRGGKPPPWDGPTSAPALPAAGSGGAQGLDLSGLYEDTASSAPTGPAAAPQRAATASPVLPATDEVACCSGPFHGLLPSTRRSEPAAPSCDWSPRPSSFLSGFAFENEAFFSQETAREFCVELGPDCSGITCTADGGHCTVRSGLAPLPSPSGETTFLKECRAATAADPGACQQEARAWDPSGNRPQLQNAAVVVLAHSRDQDLRVCLQSLLDQADSSLFSFFVSMDDRSHEAELRQVVQNVSTARGRTIGAWLVEPLVPDPKQHNEDQIKWFKWNTAKIAHHYWVALEKIFMQYRYDYVIFVEEDLYFSPDFLALFRSTFWLLEADPSLWCVSGWNDVGFAGTFSDSCRLLRTSYFPGLGFSLPRRAWLEMREMWPVAPTMGWDYWMRTAFRQKEKECIVPEISRSHHASSKGSSVTSEKQFKLLRSMALAHVRNVCAGPGFCGQFGDVSYLLEDAYDKLLRKAVRSATILKLEDLLPFAKAKFEATGMECKKQLANLGNLPSPEACARRALAREECSRYFIWSTNVEWGCRCCRGGAEPWKPHTAWNGYSFEEDLSKDALLDRNKLYALPYTYEEYEDGHATLMQLLGLMPRGTAGAIPTDLRAEHYGLALGRHAFSRARVLLVDRRSPRNFLPEPYQIRKSPDMTAVASARNESCLEACQAKGLSCDEPHLPFMNDCRTLQKHFHCQWCAHQVGEELPVFVADETQPTYGQCLVTFISPLRCHTKHASTQRLCSCMPNRPRPR